MLIIANGSCSAECAHCQHAGNYSLPSDSHHLISTSSSDFIIISGGEPLELSDDRLQLYVSECIRYHKFYRIATGGHIPISTISTSVYHNTMFLGFSIGTDIILEIQNSFYKLHSGEWRSNIEYLNENNINYSLTITLKPNMDLKPLLNTKVKLNPDFILLNYLDGRWRDSYSPIINALKIFLFDVDIVNGYTNKTI
jgi:hypothetical protein